VGDSPVWGSLRLAPTSLPFGVLLAANGCPLDSINCAIPYDDLNISNVVIIDATQYCHVDNCTVKIIKTGDELNITYHNDQYHLSCTTTTLLLLEVNDNITSYCEQEEDVKQSLFHIISDYAAAKYDSIYYQFIDINCDSEIEKIFTTSNSFAFFLVPLSFSLQSLQ